ncbi:MAG: tyrosine-type recombinase/integrase [Planctomycetota bacterium]|jgi:integrase
MTEATVTDIAEAYREFRKVDCSRNTLRADRSALRVLKEMGVAYISGLTMPDAIKYRAHRSAAGASTCTINAEWAAVNRLIEFAVATQMCESNPIALLKRLKDSGVRPRRFFTLEEIRELIAHMPAHWRLLFQFLICTGMRNAEARCLPWSEVDLDAGVVLLPKDRTKMGREHLVFLGPLMVEKLRDIPEFSDSKYVFANPDTDLPYNATSLGRAMKDAAESACWTNRTGVSPQTLRRSFAKIAYQRAGKDKVLVGKLLGHKGKDVTEECYLEADDPDARAAVAMVEALVLGEGE